MPRRSFCAVLVAASLAMAGCRGGPLSLGDSIGEPARSETPLRTADGWSLYQSVEGRFSIAAPGTVAESTRRWERSILHVFDFESRSVTGFSLRFVAYYADLPRRRVDGRRYLVGLATRSIRSIHGRLIRLRHVSLDGASGILATYRTDRSRGELRLYLDGVRLYEIGASGPDPLDRMDAAAVHRFLRSFRITAPPVAV